MAIDNLQRIFGPSTRDLLNSIGATRQGAAVRKQVAVVHSVIDQIDHHRSSDACADLRDQAKEELLRLMRLMNGARPILQVERRDRCAEAGKVEAG